MASPNVVEQNCCEQSRDQQERPQQKPKVVVVIAGMVGSGKSTALNNVFGTKFKSEYSARSRTKLIDAICLEGEESDIIIVDTPGFGATDLPTAEVKKQFEDSISYLDCVLIYCYSISPTNSQSIADELVVKNLEQVLGKGIWKKCVVLLTSSDIVRKQSCPKVEDRETYKRHIHNHAVRFSEMLTRNCGGHIPSVKSVFEIDIDEEDIEDIIAVPVGLELKEGKEKHVLVPGIEDANWLDIALVEIIRKAKKENREVFLDHMPYGKRSILGAAAAGIGAGAAIGLAGGVVVGATTLGFGAAVIPIGVAIGAVLGGFVSTTSGLSVGVIRRALIASKKKERLRKLENVQRISSQPVQPTSQDSSHDDEKDADRATPSELAPRTHSTIVESLPVPITHEQVKKSATNSYTPPPVIAEVPDSGGFTKDCST